eukprot:gene16328-19423_t
MSTPARRRLMRDFKRLQNDPPAGISGAPMENNILQWQAVIFGPEDTPWEGGTFKLSLQFSEEYPNDPPQVRFLSKMFHPNANSESARLFRENKREYNRKVKEIVEQSWTS